MKWTGWVSVGGHFSFADQKIQLVGLSVQLSAFTSFSILFQSRFLRC
jgi:hypothetical protein